MKKLLFLLAISVSSFSIAQDDYKKLIGEFSTVKVYDLIEVNMIKSDTNRVVISGKNADDVSIVNRNGKLKIKMKLKEIFDGNETKVTLYYSKVDVVDANEGAKVLIEDTIKQFEIDLLVQEGGKINADIETTYANIRAVTGGVIEVTGEVKNQDISIYTGGVYLGEECITKNTDVAIRAAGEARVNVTDDLDIKIRAGGDVYIYGNPEKVDESRVFGGRVKRMN